MRTTGNRLVRFVQDLSFSCADCYQREEWTGWIDGMIPADDIIPEAVRVDSPSGLSGRGRAIFRERVWVVSGSNRFVASVRVSETSDEILRYLLRFADANRELGEVPYGQQVRRPAWFFPQEWLFTFSKGIQRSISTG